MNKVTSFFQESYEELTKHMTWVTWPQLQKYAIIIIVFMIIFSLIVWAMDSASSAAMMLLYSMFQ